MLFSLDIGMKLIAQVQAVPVPLPGAAMMGVVLFLILLLFYRGGKRRRLQRMQ